jgi:signal transduction histidine kinase
MMSPNGAPDLQTVIDALPGAVVVHAPDGSIIAFNARAPEILGLTPEQFQGRSAIDPLWRAERLDGSLMEQTELPTNVARLTGRTVIDESFWLRVGDAPRRFITGSAAPLQVGAPTPCAVVVTFRDESDRYELVKEIRQQQKVEAIGAFAMGITHDLANMLQVIGGAARALNREVTEGSPTPEARRALDDLTLSIERGTEMSRHLLTFARGTSTAPEVIDAYDEITTIGTMLRRLLPDRMALTLDLVVNAGQLRIYRTEFEQVLLNLVVNARNAIGEVGTITIRCAPLPDQRLQIEVIDDGPGMMAPSASDSPVPSSGNGLGLGIVRRIIDGARGSFVIESGPAGTVCRVVLPVEPRDQSGKSA